MFFIIWHLIVYLGEKTGFPGQVRRTADPSASLGSLWLLIWLLVCGWKAPNNICQCASPGFLRLRSGQALRLRARSRPLYESSARRFAQDDGFVGRLKTFPGRVRRTADPSAPLGMTKGTVAFTLKVVVSAPIASSLWGRRGLSRRLRCARCGATSCLREVGKTRARRISKGRSRGRKSWTSLPGHRISTTLSAKPLPGRSGLPARRKNAPPVSAGQ